MRRVAFVVGMFLLAAGLSACETNHPTAYTTSYNWWDNNPPHSAEICCPAVHAEAGGIGTYADPITVAVDYAGSSGTTMQFAPGTRFYIPNERAYFVVEDRTGEHEDDNTAEHNGTDPHLDLWSDGRTSTEANAFACMSQITHEGIRVIEDPADDYLVVAGPLAHDNQCRANYGDTAWKA